MQQVDFDGTASFAGMVELNLSEQNSDFQFYAYPNPVKDGLLKMELYSGEEERVRIAFTDLNGKVLRKEVHAGLIGPQKLELNVSGLPSGIYLLSVSTTRQNLHHKIVID